MSSIVTSAISHLKELERNMRMQDKNFKNEDIENCDRIAELLQELVIIFILEKYSTNNI
jgi:hypothetical protein